MKIGYLAIVSACLVGCSGSVSDKITFNMSWLPQGSMSGVIVAIDQGFYSDVGLDVEAVRGFGGIRTANELDQGMFDFAYVDPLAIILNRSNGGRTRMIGSINTRWPAALCYVPERHAIDEPADLTGKTVGGGANSPMQLIVPAWLERNGVDSGAVNLMQLDPAVVVGSLIEGQIDAGECWLGNSIAVFQRRAAEAGLTLDWLEYDLDIYGSGLGTSDRMLEEQPDLVRRFVEATYRGYAWSRDNPEAAAEIVTRHFPVLDPDITLQQVREISELIEDEQSNVDGLGWIDESKVLRTLDFLVSAYDVEASIEAQDIYTTEFLE